jgi:K+/H+ antiporter YhaU regulatory subunit KhtT
MSFGIAAIFVGSLVNSIASKKSASAQVNAQREANRIQQQANEESRQQQIQDMRRQNQQQADLSSILEGEMSAENPSTMVSGIGGIDPSRLTLGRGSQLLGG